MRERRAAATLPESSGQNTLGNKSPALLSLLVTSELDWEEKCGIF
jgi:hypothetical protein